MQVKQGKNDKSKVSRIAGVVLIVAVALVSIVLKLLPSASEPPSVAAELSAHDAIGFVAVESPDFWLQQFDRSAGHLSDEEKRSLATVLSPQSRKAAMGFDPTNAGDWQDVGVDPKVGLAFTWDAQHLQGALPASFLWMAHGAPQTQQLAGLKWQTNADWAVAGLPVAAQPTPTAWTEPDGPRLDRDPVLRAAFADMPGEQRAAFYLHADGLRTALRPHLDGQKLAALEYLTQRIRGVSLILGPWETGGRIVLSSDAVESLRQIFGDVAPRQRFSQFLPKDGVLALRVSLNLQELFDGLMTWLPPQWMEARLGLASGRLGLLALVGLDWTQLERALSGQAVLALDLSAPSTPETPVPWLATLAVRDAAVADATLQHLAQQSTQRGKPMLVAQIAGHSGWQSQQPPLVVVRIADTLLVTPSMALAERALKRPEPLQKMAELDGDVVLGLVFQPSTGSPRADAPASWQKVVADLQPLCIALHRDTHGLRLEAGPLPIAGLLHLAAWFVRVPQNTP